MKKYKPETFGVMLDLSRNAVMSVTSFKKHLGYLKKMGYNAVYFYNEDAYEVEGEPYFGYLRGRYTREEMRELDDFIIYEKGELAKVIKDFIENN